MLIASHVTSQFVYFDVVLSTSYDSILFWFVSLSWYADDCQVISPHIMKFALNVKSENEAVQFLSSSSDLSFLFCSTCVCGLERVGVQNK